MYFMHCPTLIGSPGAIYGIMWMNSIGRPMEVGCAPVWGSKGADMGNREMSDKLRNE